MFGRRKPRATTDKVRAWIWPRGGFKRAGRYLWRRVARIRATPHGIAAGFAAGTAVSFLPLPGLHFVLGAALALGTRGSVIASMIGTAIGNPWTFPFIWLGAYKIGHTLGIGANGIAESSIGDSLKMAVADLLNGNFRDAAIESWPVLAPALVGGAIMSACVWALVYFAIKPIVARYQARRSQNMAAGRARWRRPKAPAPKASGEQPG
jgi:uncharacterized protein (DUF2062 family)